MMSSQPSPYDLNDLQSDMAHLAELIGASVDTIMECDFGPAYNRLPHMDRLNALLWIARDMANDLNSLIEDNYQEIGTTRAAERRPSTCIAGETHPWQDRAEVAERDLRHLTRKLAKMEDRALAAEAELASLRRAQE